MQTFVERTKTFHTPRAVQREENPFHFSRPSPRKLAYDNIGLRDMGASGTQDMRIVPQ